MNSSKEKDAIAAFDTLYTKNEIQLLKLLMPCICHEARPLLATFIKIQELNYCYALLNHTDLQSISFDLSNIDSFLELAKPYCNQKQTDLLQQVRSLRNTMKMFETYKPIFEQMQGQEGNSMVDLFKNLSSQSNSSFSMEDILMQNFTSDQKDLFEQYKKQFNS